MESWGKRVEIVVDKLIPYVVVLLLAVIVLQFATPDWVHEHEIYIQVFDYFIMLVFGIDLVFKYRRVHHFSEFMRKYWLDVVAIFPFYLVFRIFEESFLIFRAGEQLSDIQPLIHSGVEIEKAAADLIKESGAASRIAKEAEIGAKAAKEAGLLTKEAAELSRTKFIFRILRPISQTPRLAKAVAYYEDPSVEHKKVRNFIKKELKQAGI